LLGRQLANHGAQARTGQCSLLAPAEQESSERAKRGCASHIGVGGVFPQVIDDAALRINAIDVRFVPIGKLPNMEPSAV